jgi:hypothetical protein
MDNKTSFDRSLLIPIFIGFFSVLGICLVLFAARLGAARGNVQSNDTATPIKYQYLATEPGVVFPTEAASPTESLPVTIIPTQKIFLPTLSLSTATLPVISTAPIQTNQTKSINTAVSITPTYQSLNATYDDADFKLLYTGNWTSQSGVSDTYQNTLHVSSTIGDSVQLSFVGQNIHLTYQAGPSLGAIAIKLDTQDYVLDQASATTDHIEWESPVLVLSSHTITITHISGGSVNIDSFSVIDLSTPTPTPTVTP